MTATPFVSPARCAAVWIAATGTAAALIAWLVPVTTGARAAAATPAPAFDVLLTGACAAGAVAATGWLWALTTLVVVEALRGSAPTTGVPAVVRRLVLAACGVAVVAGLAGPVQATPGDLHVDRARPRAAVAGLPYPDRAVAAPHATARAGSVVVRPGDSLWRIADRELGAGTRWPELYALNRDAIGPDPDLIQPALRLRLPTE